MWQVPHPVDEDDIGCKVSYSLDQVVPVTSFVPAMCQGVMRMVMHVIGAFQMQYPGYIGFGFGGLISPVIAGQDVYLMASVPQEMGHITR